jgi:hypothetical protein
LVLISKEQFRINDAYLMKELREEGGSLLLKILPQKEFNS